MTMPCDGPLLGFQLKTQNLCTVVEEAASQDKNNLWTKFFVERL